MSLLHFYRTPFLSAEQTNSLVREAQQTISPGIRAIETEACFNVETQSVLSASEQELLTWLLRETFEPGQFADSSFLDTDALVLEVGPRMSFSTAWSTNAVSVPPLPAPIFIPTYQNRPGRFPRPCPRPHDRVPVP